MQEKILIVDDSKFTRTLLQAPLVKAGYQVTTIGEPQTAMTYILREKPDLIISDLKMPSMIDGLGFLKMLSLEVKTTPVVVYTSEPDPKQFVGDIGLDTLVLMKKPVSAHELRKKIRELLAIESKGR